VELFLPPFIFDMENFIPPKKEEKRRKNSERENALNYE
jgi:hypothetical protein